LAGSKIAIDTNILGRCRTRWCNTDRIRDEINAPRRDGAIAVSSLCEFVWVLRSVYRFRPSDIAKAIRTLLAAENVETNRLVVDAGLALLDAGGDFADGVIAYEGSWLGAETFVSFDKKAVEMLREQGIAGRVL
jgi:predicted nucleic-acid-binding protein